MDQCVARTNMKFAMEVYEGKGVDQYETCLSVIDLS